MRLFPILLLFCFALGFSQKYSKQERQLLSQTEKLDYLMQNNDSGIIDLFEKDVSFGHSNGWIQNLDDFKKDFLSKKVIYKEIRQTEISEIKKFNNTFSIRRKINVSGLYKNQEFKMTLSLLEIWIKKNSGWKLWSRQSVEIKP
ncbi:nuclear transport factor 2 family protein [Chryseobacterium binzhouense]|uniref:nuclear transport factor 2 family protein n=1 Tax=Chryseobacterium binzhouense TaxID=2593646 RepID=UPI00117E4D21|nr:nuclear transport factor 2 family protein [Chryseobacterium binzhouense]